MSTEPNLSLLADIEAIVGEGNFRPEGRHCHADPSSASEISQLAICAQAHNATLIPVGKGGRSTPTDDMRPQILLNMGRMNHVLHLDPTSLVVHAQAGITGLVLEELLNKRGLTLGAFAPAGLGSSLGGLLAVRTPGKSSRQHGTFEDMVLGVSAVLSDGRSLHTRVAPRRASGPDFARVLCGSEGTLGIITSAHLRVHEQPESRLLVAFRLPNVEEALTAVRLAMREEASPAAMRIYDGAEAKVHLGEDCEGEEALLVAATAGPTSLAACDRNLIASAVSAVGGTKAKNEIAAAWWARRTGQGDVADLPAPNLQVSATPRLLSPVYNAIVASCHEQGLSFRAHASRFDRDGGVLFVTIFDAQGSMLGAKSSELGTVSAAAESAGAYLLGKPNASLQKFFDRLRNGLDPENLLNPGVLR
jgi:alkyldihydroxyacetonephosphate synthase